MRFFARANYCATLLSSAELALFMNARTFASSLNPGADSTPEEMDAVDRELRAMPEVKRVKFVSKDDAYKEFRILMPKVIHPYAKGEACIQCSLRGICDGFHKDYAVPVILTCLPFPGPF